MKEDAMSDQNIKETVRKEYGQIALQVVKGGSAGCGSTSARDAGDPIISNRVSNKL
jgi:hypothetical protein